MFFLQAFLFLRVLCESCDGAPTTLLGFLVCLLDSAVVVALAIVFGSGGSDRRRKIILGELGPFGLYPDHHCDASLSVVNCLEMIKKSTLGYVLQ